jgi:hypothetical protein
MVQQSLDSRHMTMHTRSEVAMSGVVVASMARMAKFTQIFIPKIARRIDGNHEVFAKSLQYRMSAPVSLRGCFGVCDVPGS